MWRNGVVGMNVCLIRFLSLFSMVLAFNLALSNEVNASAEVDEIGSISWVRGKLNKYPELYWLADSDVSYTRDYATESESDSSWSAQIFEKKYVEFERTVLSLVMLHRFHAGTRSDYDKLTSVQNDEKLSYESFQEVHTLCKNLLEKKPKLFEAMEAALIFGDMGKTNTAREKAKLLGAEYPDHDDWYEAAINTCPGIFPSFKKLSEEHKSLLQKAANIIHFGHVTHLEGGPTMFSKLQQSEFVSKEREVIDFEFFVHICDVAAAAGHVEKKGSLVYVENTHKAKMAVKEAVMLLASNNEIEAYHNYIAKRASWLNLDKNTPEGRVLARVGAMLRLFYPSEGESLKKGWDQIDTGLRTQLIEQFDLQTLQTDHPTPTYVPAVLGNIFSNKKIWEDKDQRLQQAVIIGLPFVSSVLSEYVKKAQRVQNLAKIPLNFNEVAGIAGNDPKQLLAKTFTIENDGKVGFVR